MLLSAMAMTSFLKEQEDTPPGLSRRTLEAYFMAVVRETAATATRPEELVVPQRPNVRRDREPPKLVPYGRSSEQPVIVGSSPDQDQSEEQGPPQVTRIDIIERELRSQRAQAEKSKIEFVSMFEALQDSLERVLPASAPKATVVSRQVEDRLEDLPSTSASERVEAWRGMSGHAGSTYRRAEPSPAPSL
jgi:hypothetical protein